jgi:Protein of unknown function (DUF445)
MALRTAFDQSVRPPHPRAALRQVRVVRDGATRDATVTAVDRLLEAAERRTWGDVLGLAPPERLAQSAADQIPRVVAQIRVPEMVEQKVLGFSTQRVEEIVRNVTQRELDLIVRLGYVLGGLVGLVAFLVNVLLGGAGAATP